MQVISAESLRFLSTAQGFHIVRRRSVHASRTVATGGRNLGIPWA